MFDKKRKSNHDFKGPKNTTFGNDSDEDEQLLGDVTDVSDFMKSMDKEIKDAKQQEKNASVAKVYSSQKQQTKVKSSINACGCFGS